MSTPNFSIESTPEFIAAQEAAQALQKRQDALDRARTEHERIEAQRAALVGNLDELRARRERGVREIETVERLVSAKSDQLANAFGAEGLRPGRVPDLAAEVVELTGTAAHLRKKVLVGLEAAIATAEKALATFTAEHPV